MGGGACDAGHIGVTRMREARSGGDVAGATIDGSGFGVDKYPVCVELTCSDSGRRARTGLRNGRISMLYEMRVYYCIPGRLPALLKRFETKTLKIWEKHGIRQAGFFTTVIGESNQQLVYFLAWDSLAERERKWNAFMADPEWINARAETEKDGQIVERVINQILTPTVFSSVK
jgi:hypothetical protein